MAFLATSFPFSQIKQDVVVHAKDGYFSEARLIEMEELGIERPAGLVYSVKDKDFRVISKDRAADASGPLEMTIMDEHGELESKGRKKIPNADPINIAYSASLDKILIIEPSGQRIAVVSTASEAAVESYIEIEEGKFKNPKGITVDPDDGTIYVIDQVGPRLVKIVPEADGSTDATITETLLPSLVKAKLQGIALDPTTGHLHILGTEGEILYEMKDTGEVVGTRDLSVLRLSDPQAMVFAPSYDNTDEDDTMDLYIADSGSSTDAALPGLIVELSFVAPAALAEAGFTSQLINTIDTSRFAPPAPDAASVEYIPTLNRLLIVDSEVNEMPIYAGATVFETQLDGTLVRTGHTLQYSPESTGITFNSANGKLFVSDDNKRRVFEVSIGPDGLFGTEDDVTTYFSTLNFGSNDPEGVAFDSATGTLYIADGNNAEIYKVTAGANGRFDGVSPEGDDVVTQFDTMEIGVKDPEGIGFDQQTGNLYIVGEPVDAVAEIKTDGTLVRVIDIQAAQSFVPSGIGVGPSSMNPAQSVIYVSERGVDNAIDPLENDGKVYELSLPYLPVDNTSPVLTVTSPTDNHTYSLSTPIVFTGSAQDIEDGDLSSSIQWNSSIDGLIGTGTSFIKDDLTAGTHTITAKVSDKQGLTGTLIMTIEVDPLNSSPTLSIGSPANNTSSQSGVAISFQADASDQEDGDLSASIHWNSSIDGPIGSGSTFEKSDLTVGSHKITASVTDNGGLQAESTIDLTVTAVSAGPVVTITSPSEGAIYLKGQKVVFSGTALDSKDGDRTSSLRWTSSINGSIGSKGIFAKSTLSVGTHVITATATDSEGFMGSASVTIKVIENTAPVVTITKPTDGAVYLKGQNIVFSGTALDAEDGDRTASLRWTSSIDGSIGSKGIFSKSTLSVGTHIITATATDLRGLQGSASVTIVVTENTGPVVTITGPSDGSSFGIGYNIVFTGTALDAQDGDRTSSLRWTSSIDGSIGSKGIFSKSTLSAGVHTITATATDSAGETGSASITIIVSQVMKFSVSEDTTVTSYQPDTSFGTGIRLDAVTSSYFSRSYLKFTTSGLSGTISRAKLRIFVSTTRTDGGSIYEVSNHYINTATPWLESQMTWNNAPALTESPLSSAGAVSAGKWVEFDVTDAITGDGTYSFALTTSSDLKVSYYSKDEVRYPAYWPELSIEFAP